MLRTKWMVCMLLALICLRIPCQGICAMAACRPAPANPDPPCHRHHDHTGNEKPAHCAQYVLATAPELTLRAAAHRTVLFAGAAEAVSDVPPGEAPASEVPATATPSPPPQPPLTSVVLRI